MSEQPKKPRRKKAKKLVLNKRKSWQEIVNSVEKNEIPVNILQQITVELIDGTMVTIGIKDLIQDGYDPVEVQDLLNEKLQELDQYIHNVDFFVDIDAVVETVQPETDRVLKNL
jgi:hypothetical protein